MNPEAIKNCLNLWRRRPEILKLDKINMISKESCALSREINTIFTRKKGSLIFIFSWNTSWNASDLPSNFSTTISFPVLRKFNSIRWIWKAVLKKVILIPPKKRNPGENVWNESDLKLRHPLSANYMHKMNPKNLNCRASHSTKRNNNKKKDVVCKKSKKNKKKQKKQKKKKKRMKKKKRTKEKNLKKCMTNRHPSKLKHQKAASK